MSETENLENPEPTVPVFTIDLTVRDPDNQVVGCRLHIQASDLLSMHVDAKEIFAAAIAKMQAKLFEESLFKEEEPIKLDPSESPFRNNVN